MRQWTALAAVLALAGCTYGPEQERSVIQNFSVRPGSYQFAIALHYERFRPPTGLSAFPDGGKTRVLAQSAILYLADAAEGSVRELARMDAPEVLRTSFQPHVDGWQGKRLFFTLSGCPGDECYGKLLQRRHYVLEPGGMPEPVDALPQRLERAPGMLARAPGERMYLRVSSDSSLIRVRTEDGGAFRPFCRALPSGALARAGK